MKEFLLWFASFIVVLFGVTTLLVFLFKYMSWLIDLVGGF